MGQHFCRGLFVKKTEIWQEKIVKILFVVGNIIDLVSNNFESHLFFWKKWHKMALLAFRQPDALCSSHNNASLALVMMDLSKQSNEQKSTNSISKRKL